MKTTLQFFGALALLFFINTTIGHSQIWNSDINVVVRPDRIYYAGAGDAQSQSELNFVGRIRYEEANIGWTPGECYDFFGAQEPSILEIVDNDYHYPIQEGLPFYERIRFSYEAWERDSSSIYTCIYQGSNSGDDDYINSTAIFSWTSEFFTTNSGATEWRAPSTWHNDHNDSNDGWLTINEVWNFKLGMAWRYTAGNTPENPLEFGELSEGTTVSNRNSTLTFWEDDFSWMEGILTYSNNSDNLSPDVYYSFELTNPARVTISTDSENSIFDTYLRLYFQNDLILIEENDDIDIENDNYLSEISLNLNAGVYVIQVEGFDVSEGEFELSITTEESTGTSVEYIDPDLELSVFPNPASNVLNIKSTMINQGQNFVQIIDLSGRIVREESIAQSTLDLTQIDISSLPKGMYSIRVYNESKTVDQKFVKL